MQIKNNFHLNSVSQFLWHFVTRLPNQTVFPKIYKTKEKDERNFSHFAWTKTTSLTTLTYLLMWMGCIISEYLFNLLCFILSATRFAVNLTARYASSYSMTWVMAVDQRYHHPSLPSPIFLFTPSLSFIYLFLVSTNLGINCDFWLLNASLRSASC